MSNYSPTDKQVSYYKSLTGKQLPANCTKSTASRLISAAIAAKSQQDRYVPRVQLVYDHCGREHAKNEEGEWLY